MVTCCPPPPPPRANTHHVLLRLLHVLYHPIDPLLVQYDSTCCPPPRAASSTSCALHVRLSPHAVPPYVPSRPTCCPLYTCFTDLRTRNLYTQISRQKGDILHSIYSIYIQGGRKDPICCCVAFIHHIFITFRPSGPSGPSGPSRPS